VNKNSPLSQAIITGDWDKAAKLTKEAVNSGKKPHDIIAQELQPAMFQVGEKFSTGEYFLPDMLMAGRAMSHALEVLEPLLGQTGAPTIGKIAIGTVKGDIHDIGKNIVIMFLQGTGFEIHDIGVDVSDEKFVEMVKAEKPDILGMSSLITTTMPSLSSVIKALEEAGLRNTVKVIVGGAPVTQHFADSIGADAYARDAGEAALVCRQLISS
jgi:5-methyltetrahydrofolate--homocysteine methyltransferase